ncbi:sterile alpha motif domain-containing protein 15 [Tenrec ecaudatus]|uniref:sterile alpha motif domain-containing protein 15 n=1 Tax=Tenrec ecaudatus TaxID=94439 RepID=UPI003F59C9F7
MAKVPEDYDSGSDEDEDPSSEKPDLPELSKAAEDAKPDDIAEADQAPPPEAVPETEDRFEEPGPDSAKNAPGTPARTPEKDVSKESGVDLAEETQPGTPPETSREMGGELVTDLEVPVEEQLKEPGPEAPKETILDGTENVSIESVEETDLELPKETMPEDLGSTLPETAVDLLEEPRPGVSEESHSEPYEAVVEGPLDQTKPKFPSDTPGKSIEGTDPQTPEVTASEIPEKARRESVQEQEGGPLEQTAPEFLEQARRKSIEADLEASEVSKPEFTEETGRKSLEEQGTEPPEQIPPEAPEDTGRKSPLEQGTEPPEQIPPEFPEEAERKSPEEQGTEPPEQTPPEAPEETGRKSPLEQGTEPPEQTPPEAPELTLRKSIETTMQNSTKKRAPGPLELTEPLFPKEESIPREGTGPGPLEKTQPEVPKDARRESYEEQYSMSSMSDLEQAQEIKPEVQGETHRKSTKEKDRALPVKVSQPYRRTYVKSSMDDKSEPIKLQFSGEAEELEYLKYQIRKSTEKETRDSVLDVNRENEAELTETDVKFSEELLKITDHFIKDESFDSLESRWDLETSGSEQEVLDFTEEEKELVPEDKDTHPDKLELQFEFLKWSPQDVADWISKLGFPHYEECFTTNFISGRKLIYVNCANLPQMGITKFEDMKIISRHTRELLGIEEPLFKRSITLPRRDNMGLFLEQKSHTGVKSNSLTLSTFVQAARLQEYAPQKTNSEENTRYSNATDHGEMLFHSV